MDARLAAWRARPALRAATRGIREALARRWAEAGPLAALSAALDALGDLPSAASVAALVRPLLEDAGWLEDGVAMFAAAVRDDPLLDPPLVPLRSAAHEGLLLFQHRHAVLFAGVGARERLAAKRLRPRGGSIVVPGELGLVRVLRSGAATLSLWHGGWRDGLVMPSAEPAGTRTLADGEVYMLDGRATGYVVEHARGDMVLLQATILADPAPTLCEYDAATRALSATGAAREEASRAQLLLMLLAELDVPDARAFEPASRAPEPFLRWHAMRAWAATDAAAAGPRLAEMASTDPDAELRGLARATLDLVAAACRA